MCWVGLIHDKKIAKKDITVYKVLYRFGRKNKIYYAPFRDDYHYKMGYHYTIDKLGMKRDGMYAVINEGYHCYSLNAYANTQRDGKILNIYSSNNDRPCMLHCYVGKLACKTIIFKCTIPKGSTYYINKKGEIVTDNLILDRDLGIPANISPLRFREIHKNHLFK